MTSKINVSEQGRDDDFGILKKRVSFPGSYTVETPVKCVKNPSSSIINDSSINEIIKKISPKILESIWDGTDTPSRSIKSRYIDGKINLTIFELMFNKIPNKDRLKSLASYWYAASQSVLFLPTTSTSMLKENKEDKKISEKRLLEYVDILRYMIETTEAIGNHKAFMGTIPLLAPKFTAPIIKLYLEKGFTAFAIDVNTKDFLNHESDFRTILTTIGENVSLNKTFIYACNLGISQFEAHRARADDFLSFFAYVDAFGSTFKTRGGGSSMPSISKPRVKKFLKAELCYEHIYDSRDRMNDFNQCEHVKETTFMRTLIGNEKMKKYLETKKAVDQSALKRLDSIAQKVKIK